MISDRRAGAPEFKTKTTSTQLKKNVDALEWHLIREGFGQDEGEYLDAAFECGTGERRVAEVGAGLYHYFRRGAVSNDYAQAPLAV
jgi:hypothetical protein